MAGKRRISSVDLAKFRLPGDVQLSPDGTTVAYTVTSMHLDTNDYETTIWSAPADGAAPPRQLTRGTGAKGRAGDRSPRFAPDGRRLAFVSGRAGAGADVWLLDLVGGGEAARLTSLGGSVSGLCWSPDGRWLAIAAKPAKPKAAEPGDWVAGGWRPGENPDVTVVTKLRYKFNGVGFIDDRHTKLYVVDADSGSIVRVTGGLYDDGTPSWSPDGNWLVFPSSRRPDRELRPRGDLWAVDVTAITAGSGLPTAEPDGSEAVHLSAGHPGSLFGASFSPDGHWLLATGTDGELGGAYNAHLWLIPFEHARRELTAGESARGGLWLDILAGFDRSIGSGIGTDVKADGGSGEPLWSADGRYVYFTATDGGYSRLYRCRVPVGVPLDNYVPKIEALSDDSYAAVGSFALAEPAGGGGRLAMMAGDALNPGEVYAAALADRVPESPLTDPLTAAGCPVRLHLVNWRQLTACGRWLEDYELAQPQRVIFPSIENGRIEGWLMRPIVDEALSAQLPAEEKRHPVILEIHGGPHATYGLAFMHEFQLLCARGFGVFFTNPRGSKGYGFDFADRVVGDWAGIDYHDLMAAADCLERVRWADPARMGVTGGSQGGYLTNFLIGHTTRFAAAVTQRSMSNLYTKYGVSDIGWTGDKHGMGGADLWTDEDFIMERSPIRYAPYVRTPTLIIHSEQDLRCPMEQGEQWYIALKRLGVETEFVRFAGENHELSRGGKPRNRVERLERIVGWFERWMPGKG